MKDSITRFSETEVYQRPCGWRFHVAVIFGVLAAVAWTAWVIWAMAAIEEMVK